MNNRVVVIFQNPEYNSNGCPFPPVGTKGTLASEIDEYGDFDVMFDSYPCPVSLPDTSWVTHKSMVVYIDELNINNVITDRAEVYHD